MRVVSLICCITAGILFINSNLNLLNAFFLSILLVGLPGMAITQMRMPNVSVISRKEAYLTSGMAIILMGSLALGLGLGTGGPTGMSHYIQLGNWPREILIAFVLTILGIGLLMAFSFLRRISGLKETEIVAQLMPVTSEEKLLFSGLSVCAGLGEEVAYRGYAISAVVMAGGSAPFAAIVTSVAFGLVHSYQGFIGIFRTGIFGLIMGSALLYTESLWSLVLAHILIDLLVGLVLTKKLLD